MEGLLVTCIKHILLVIGCVIKMTFLDMDQIVIGVHVVWPSTLVHYKSS